jgi:hypothetical protein
MLCYHFPPMGTTGALRPARLLRYLPADVEVDVLTVASPPEGGGNEALWREIEARVTRHEAPLRPRAVQRRLEAALARTVEGGLPSKAWKTLATWCAWVPDRQVAFVDGAVEAGAALCGRRRPDVLFSSSPPHSLHLAAVRLKQRCGVPLVCDFRDPWSDNPERRWPSALHRAHERRLEARVLRAADLVLANTPGNALMLRRSFPWLPEGRVAVLPNGFDPARRAALSAAAPVPRADGRRVVLYTGHVYAGGAPAFEALAALLARRPDLPARVLFRCVGSMDPPVARLCGPLERAGLLERAPAVPAGEVPALLASADALFYVVPPAGRHWIPSKLYDYLLAGKPVLAVLPRGDAWDVLERAGAGVLLETDGPEDVAARLGDALERLLAGTLALRPDPAALLPYDARTQAAQLARWLRALAGRPAEGSPAAAQAAAP